jgi:endonuclease/exonuclease/phosphatase family metal-dependent hydrolase
MKVLSCNAGYLLDYDGSLSGYVLRPHRAVVGSERAERRALDRLVDVIADEQPDVVSLVEVDQGSLRTATDGQVAAIAAACRERGLEYRAHADSKYGEEGVLATLPVLEELSNGLLLRDSHEAHTHYIETGPKRLVNEVELAPGLSLFVVHVAMRGSTRRQQLEEIHGLVSDRDSAVVCGDFNAYDGLDELEVLTEAGMTLHNPGETVPKRPFDFVVTETRTLDLFLTTPDIAVSRCDVIDVQISDHRPVVLELSDWGRESQET